MGDFCVAGFHSRLPIYDGNKVVAIICRGREKDRRMSNVPCYLESPLIPFCMPVVGYMNDYGYLDETEYSAETDETIRIIEELSGKEICKVIKDIVSTSQYEEDKNVPDFYRKFDRCAQYVPKDAPVGRYYVIYEHYDIYKAMTFEWDGVETYCEKLQTCLDNIKENTSGFSSAINPFKERNDNMLSAFLESTYELQLQKYGAVENVPEEELVKIRAALQVIRDNPVPPGRGEDNIVRPSYAICNVEHQSNYFMGMYTTHQIDARKAKRQMAEFCSFIVTFEQIYGHFYWSVSAGQSWHHDEDYWKTLDTVQKTYDETVKMLKDYKR